MGTQKPTASARARSITRPGETTRASRVALKEEKVEDFLHSPRGRRPGRDSGGFGKSGGALYRESRRGRRGQVSMKVSPSEEARAAETPPRKKRKANKVKVRSQRMTGSLGPGRRG